MDEQGLGNLPWPSRQPFSLGKATIGGPQVTLWCGPCAIESRAQIMKTAAFLSSRGVPILRGGAFKPRTSPWDFQGIGEAALGWLAEAGERYNMITVSEILDVRHLSLMASCVDILQIGTRGMYNYALLRAVGQQGHPVLLKRGMSAELAEFLLAAQYILRTGNDRLILCERGIRTFETWTRNTLDLAAVPLCRQVAGLPMIVDLSHSLGRTDIMPWMARSALAAGADGLMCEVHPDPASAKSDGRQSLNFEEFERLQAFIEPVKRLLEIERGQSPDQSVPVASTAEQASGGMSMRRGLPR